MGQMREINSFNPSVYLIVGPEIYLSPLTGKILNADNTGQPIQ